MCAKACDARSHCQTQGAEMVVSKAHAVANALCQSMQQLHAELTQRYDGHVYDLVQLDLLSLPVLQRNAGDRGKVDNCTSEARARAELPA